MRVRGESGGMGAYKLVQVVAEEVGAGVASVTVVHPEEGAGGPGLVARLVLRPGDVQNDRHSVFVIRAHDALVGVGAVGGHHAVAADRVLGGLVVAHEEVDLPGHRDLVQPLLHLVVVGLVMSIFLRRVKSHLRILNH